MKNFKNKLAAQSVVFLMAQLINNGYALENNEEFSSTQTREHHIVVNDETDSDEEQPIIIGNRKRNIHYVIDSDDEDTIPTHTSSEALNDSPSPQAIHTELPHQTIQIPNKHRRAAGNALQAFTEAVKSGLYTDRDELIEGTRYKPSSVAGLFSDARKEGLLTEEEIQPFTRQYMFRSKVAELVRQKKTEEEILSFCQQHENAREKTDHYLSRNYLRGLFQYLYNENLLTSHDTAYLKMDGTVVNRRGGTKDKIIQFLTERSKDAPTDTRKALAEEFNAFTEGEFNMRPIDAKTFAAHVNELIKAKKLTETQIDFFNSCKEQKQQEGYVPTSKRFYRR